MSRKNKTTIGIVLTAILCCAGMAVVDGMLHLSYGTKSLVKLVLFLLLPFILSIIDRSVSIRGMFHFRGKGILKPLGLGAGLYGLILGAYFVAARFYDFSGIVDSLQADVGVDRENFVYVAIYISFLNSLLEEYFFRGFVFVNLKSVCPRWFAYVFSSVLFAVYHVAMMDGWFNLLIFLLVMAGLTAGGMIFCRLNEKLGTIHVSWFVHMFANFAINTIGFILMR